MFYKTHRSFTSIEPVDLISTCLFQISSICFNKKIKYFKENVLICVSELITWSKANRGIVPSSVFNRIYRVTYSANGQHKTVQQVLRQCNPHFTTDVLRYNSKILLSCQATHYFVVTTLIKKYTTELLL